MAFKQAALPYSLGALEPHISQETLEYHYGKHHKAYVDKLNAAVEANSALQHASLVEVIRSSQGGIYNNAAQVWNHEFYWNCLSPAGGGEPQDADFMAALQQNFGSYAAFKQEFHQASAGLFGSGWTFLVKDNQGALKILQEGNAGCPVSQEGLIPLLTCDVWEHAYYVDYRNARPRYLEAYWSLVNWPYVVQNWKHHSLPQISSQR